MVLKTAGGSFNVRATITPQTVDRQTEIVAYLHEHLLAEDIRFEPVYQVRGYGKTGFRPDDATRFVRHFLEAQKEAFLREITLSFSGVRLEELHGSYCDALRNALHLNPDGTATACFFSTDGLEANGVPFVIGHLDENTEEFVLNRERIEEHRRLALKIPACCHDCLNMYHCARMPGILQRPCSCTANVPV